MLLRERIAQYPWLFRTLVRARASWKKGAARRIVHYCRRGHLRRPVEVRRFLNRPGPHCLQVGCGLHPIRNSSWINGDWVGGEIYLDAAKRLPFPDSSLDALFTEHFIEHLPQTAVRPFLSEAHRVLKPGGVIRQSTPDLQALIEIYRDERSVVAQRTVLARHFRTHGSQGRVAANGCQYVNDMFRLWGHQFLFDRDTMRDVLLAAGFEEPQWVEYGVSEVPYLSSVERHADEDWMKSGFVMICEARKKLIREP